MPKADEANYACETTREAIHADLDEKYSKRDPDFEAFVKSVEKAEGNKKQAGVELHSEDGVVSISVVGSPVLDREACLVLAKKLNAAAQSVA